MFSGIYLLPLALLTHKSAIKTTQTAHVQRNTSAVMTINHDVSYRDISVSSKARDLIQHYISKDQLFLPHIASDIWTETWNTVAEGSTNSSLWVRKVPMWKSGGFWLWRCGGVAVPQSLRACCSTGQDAPGFMKYSNMSLADSWEVRLMQLCGFKGPS